MKSRNQVAGVFSGGIYQYENQSYNLKLLGWCSRNSKDWKIQSFNRLKKSQSNRLNLDWKYSFGVQFDWKYACQSIKTTENHFSLCKDLNFFYLFLIEKVCTVKTIPKRLFFADK